jgi:hypothetical protein
MFERYLGRALTAEERGAVPTLNDVTPAILREATVIAQASVVAATTYLQEVVKVADLDSAAEFVKEVVCGGGAAATWRVADRLCIPTVDLAVLLTRGTDAILEPLLPVEGDRWWMFKPIANNWNHTSFCGAPGVIVRGARYWFRGPRHTTYTSVQADDVTPVSDLAIAVRRWIASRLAWNPRLRPAEARTSPAAICETFGVAMDAVSEDGRIVLDAVIRELAMEGSSPAPPGFRGPDEWYARP